MLLNSHHLLLAVDAIIKTNYSSSINVLAPQIKLVYQVISISSHTLVCNVKFVPVSLFVFSFLQHILLYIIHVIFHFNLHALLFTLYHILLLTAIKIELINITIFQSLLLGLLAIKRTVSL